MKSQLYRPDIDGLRAVAIIPVVLFHAGLEIFSGGYVGVDVFFVISGYLITSLILGEVDAGEFRFVNFWVRRARRILPALFVVSMFTLVAGWALFFPTDYRDLGRTVLTQSIFSSNVYFWLKSGYFAAPSETKPLLHTWSLSVEEQYYLFIPVTLYLLTKFLKPCRDGAILLLLILSFLISAWSSFAYPDAAFFLPHTRAWELLVGSLLAMMVRKRKPEPLRHGWRNELLSAVGLSAILVATVTFTKSTPFPGIAALAPCLGSAAVIWSNRSRLTYVGRILAHRRIVWVGLISYSFYLWHWPLLAFARYATAEKLASSAAIGVAVCSVLPAWFSYKYIETPVRRREVFRSRPAITLAAAMSLMLMFASGAYVNVNGASWRTAFQVKTFETDIRPSDRRLKACNKVTSVMMQYDFICRLGTVSNSRSKLLLIGDSYAEMYLRPLEKLAVSHNQEVWYIKLQTMAVYPKIIDIVEKNDISRVVLSYSWNRANKNGIPELYPEGPTHSRWLANIVPIDSYNPILGLGDTKAPFRQNLEMLVEKLRKRGIIVFIIDAPPYYPVSIPLKLGILVKEGGDPTKFGSQLSKHLAEQRYIYDVFNDIASDQVRILKVTDVLCDRAGFCRTFLDGHSLYSDEAHLSDFGAEQIFPLLELNYVSTADTKVPQNIRSLH